MHAKLPLGLIVALALGAVLSVAHAQQPTTLSASIAGLAPAGYPAAHALVNVSDATGVVKTLTAADFTVTVDGKPAPVISADLASSQNAPLDLLLLIDVSGSMAGDPMAQTKAAAKGLVDTLAPGDRVAVMSFADTVKLVQDYSTDRGATAAVIDGLVAKGNTALYDATGSAAYKAGTSSSSRRAIILLSDGAQDGVKVKTTRDQALAAAAGIGVPWFAIGEGKDIDRVYLNQIAASSNGRYVEAPRPSDLTGLFASIGDLLTGQFIVAFDAGAVSGAAQATVSITVRSAGTSVTAVGQFSPGAGFAPAPIALSLTGVTEGEALDGPRLVTAVPDSAAGITRVAFYVDGVNVFETDKSPYAFTYNPKDYGAAAHTLKAAAIVGARSFESAPVSFTSHPPVVAAKGGGGLPLLPIAAAVIGLIILLVVLRIAMVVRARLAHGGAVVVVSPEQRITPWVAKHRSLNEADPRPDDEPAAALAEDVGEPLGVLITRAGPLTGSEYIVGAKPIGIGSGARCGVRIDDREVGAEEARIWVRDGHLMLHRVTRLTDVAADGASGGWTILQPGDSLDIGQHRFEFRIWTPPVPQPDVRPEDIPNVLRDAAGPRTAPLPFPSASPATGNVGALWPRESSLRSSADGSADVDAQAS